MMEGGKEVNSAKEMKKKEDASRLKVDGAREVTVFTSHAF